MKELQFVPLKRVAQYEMEGWKVVEGCDNPQGWAVLMERVREASPRNL